MSYTKYQQKILVYIIFNLCKNSSSTTFSMRKKVAYKMTEKGMTNRKINYGPKYKAYDHFQNPNFEKKSRI